MSPQQLENDILSPITRTRVLELESDRDAEKKDPSGDTGTETGPEDNRPREALLTMDSSGTITAFLPGFLGPLLEEREPQDQEFTGRQIQELRFFDAVTKQLRDQGLLGTGAEAEPGSRKLRTVLLGSGFATSLPVDTRYLVLPTSCGKPGITLIFQPAEIREVMEEDLGFLTSEYEKMMKRYQEAGEELEVLKEMKANFMSLTSHELLTPLQIMMGNLDLLRSRIYGELNPKQQEKLEIVIRNTSRIYDITRSMYDLSRTKTRFFSLNKESTDVKALLEEIAGDFSVLLNSQGIEFRLELSEELPQIPIDRQSFWKAWSEIFDFFSHYSKAGDSLVLSAREQKENLELVLRKEGSSLSRKHRQFIFESFYEPINILNHKEGTGLQLTLAKRYVDAHGGEMWVDGKEDEAIVFHILLPKKVPLEKTLEWKMLKAEKMSGFFLDTE